MEEFDECNVNNTVLISVEEVEEYLYSTGDRLFVTVCLPIVAGFGILTNTAFLFTLFRVHSMRTMTNFYLGNLAFADVGFLITVATRHIWTYIKLSPIEIGTAWGTAAGCSAPYVITYCFLYNSVFLVTLVTVERYLAICHPLQHRTILDGTKRAVKLVALSWTLSLGLAMFDANPSTLKTECYKFLDSHKNWDTNIVVVSNCVVSCEWCWNAVYFIDSIQFFISFLITVSLYLTIIKTLDKRQVTRTGSVKLAERTLQARNAVARMLAVNAAVFFVCLLPFKLLNVESLILLYGGTGLFPSEMSKSLSWAGRILLLINSAINPVVYSVTNPSYRKAFMKAFGIQASGEEHGTVATISNVGTTKV